MMVLSDPIKVRSSYNLYVSTERILKHSVQTQAPSQNVFQNPEWGFKRILNHAEIHYTALC